MVEKVVQYTIQVYIRFSSSMFTLIHAKGKVMYALTWEPRTDTLSTYMAGAKVKDKPNMESIAVRYWLVLARVENLEAPRTM